MTVHEVELPVTGLVVGRKKRRSAFFVLPGAGNFVRKSPSYSGVDGLTEVLKRNHFWSRNWNNESL